MSDVLDENWNIRLFFIAFADGWRSGSPQEDGCRRIGRITVQHSSYFLCHQLHPFTGFLHLYIMMCVCVFWVCWPSHDGIIVLSLNRLNVDFSCLLDLKHFAAYIRCKTLSPWPTAATGGWHHIWLLVLMLLRSQMTDTWLMPVWCTGSHDDPLLASCWGKEPVSMTCSPWLPVVPWNDTCVDAHRWMLFDNMVVLVYQW